MFLCFRAEFSSNKLMKTSGDYVYVVFPPELPTKKIRSFGLWSFQLKVSFVF